MSWNQQQRITHWNMNQNSIMNCQTPFVTMEQQQQHIQQWSNWQLQYQEWHYKYGAQYLEQQKQLMYQQPPTTIPHQQEQNPQTQSQHQLKKPPQYYFPSCHQQPPPTQQQLALHYQLAQNFQALPNMYNTANFINKQVTNSEVQQPEIPSFLSQEKHEQILPKNQIEFEEKSKNTNPQSIKQITNIHLKKYQYDVEKLTITELKSKQQSINDRLNKLEKDYFDFKVFNKNKSDFLKKDNEWIEKKNDLLEEKTKIEDRLKCLNKYQLGVENINVCVKEQKNEYTSSNTTKTQLVPKQKSLENNTFNDQNFYQREKISFIHENNNYTSIPGLDLTSVDDLLENSSKEEKKSSEIIEVDLIGNESNKQESSIQQKLEPVHQTNFQEQQKPYQQFQSLQQSWSQQSQTHTSEHNSQSIYSIQYPSNLYTSSNQSTQHQLNIQQYHHPPTPITISSPIRFQYPPLPQQIPPQIKTNNVPLQSSNASMLPQSTTAPILSRDNDNLTNTISKLNEEIAYRRQNLHHKEKNTQANDKKDIHIPVSVIDYDHKQSYFQQHYYKDMKKFNYNHKKKIFMEQVFGKSIYENKVDDLYVKNVYQNTVREHPNFDYKYRRQIPSSIVHESNSEMNEQHSIINQLSLKRGRISESPTLESVQWNRREYIHENILQEALPKSNDYCTIDKEQYGFLENDRDQNWVRNREREHEQEWERERDKQREREHEHEHEREKGKERNRERVHEKESKQPKRMLEDIIKLPGRMVRPSRIVIILRGPPGSGKSYLAQVIKDTELYYGNSAPRILALDDYFDLEKTNDVQKIDKSLIRKYELSLKKAFEKTVRDGFFPLIIVDCIHDQINKFSEMVDYARSNGFQVYICQLLLDLELCLSRNIHKKSKHEIENIIRKWERTPSYYIALDPKNFLNHKANVTKTNDGAINAKHSSTSDKVRIQNDENHLGQSSSQNYQEYSYYENEKNSRQELHQPRKQSSSRINYSSDSKHQSRNDYFEDNLIDSHVSKWELMDKTEHNLAQLDGIKTKKPKIKSMKDYLKLNDEDLVLFGDNDDPTGKRRVKWADLEEKRKQSRMRAIGFVVGQTDWSRMMDPSEGKNTLTRTKYFE